MFDVIVSSAFKDGHKALQVGFDVGIRVLNRIANASLRCKMNHSLGLLGGEDVSIASRLATLSRTHERVESSEALQPCFLEVYVVIGVQIIDTDDLITSFEQTLGNRIADKARCAGHHDFHVELPIFKVMGATNGVESLKGRAVV